jgi:hypothetical protein
MTTLINELRRMTSLALPEDDSYVIKLGIAIYSFASINSFLTEIIRYLDQSQNRSELLHKESGEILKILRVILRHRPKDKITDELDFVAKEFEEYKNFRNDIVHAYPITGKKGKQILHRRLDRADKYFEVTEEFLDAFIGGLPVISQRLYKIRTHLRPEL